MSLVGTQEAARRLGCSRSTVTRQARALKIGRRVGRVLVFSAADVRRLREVVRPGPGNPQFGPGYSGRWPAD